MVGVSELFCLESDSKRDSYYHLLGNMLIRFILRRYKVAGDDDQESSHRALNLTRRFNPQQREDVEDDRGYGRSASGCASYRAYSTRCHCVLLSVLSIHIA